MDNQIKAFKIVSILEAISFLILLFIAVPLKHIFDMPQLVSIVGMGHGILFVLYLFGAYWMYEKLKWKGKTLAITIVCSAIPLGPFYIEKKYLPRTA